MRLMCPNVNRLMKPNYHELLTSGGWVVASAERGSRSSTIPIGGSRRPLPTVALKGPALWVSPTPPQQNNNSQNKL
jgi:hypothetical protein